MWKPIESAPKDGTRILVKNSNLEHPVPHIAAYTYYSNCFINVWDTDIKLYNVTHWHPIPTDNNAENVELEWWEWETKLDNVAPSHPIPTDNNTAYGAESIALGPESKANIYDATSSVDLLNWINLINTVVCLLPDVKNESVQTLIEARNKVIK